MDQQTVSWIDTRFDETATAQYRYCAIAGYDGFSYAVSDQGGRLLVLKSWDFSTLSGNSAAIESVFQHIKGADALVNLDYGHAAAAFSTPWVSLLPKRLFRADALPGYFNLLMQASEYRYAADVLADVNIAVAYALEKSLYKTALPLLGGKAASLPSVLLPVFRAAAQGNPHSIMVHVRGYRGYVAVFERENLFYYNSFAFEKPDDFLYFVLLAYEQLRLNPQEIPLQLSGNLLQDGQLYRILYRYIHSINFVKTPNGVHLPDTLKLDAPHLYFDLFSLLTSQI